MRIVAGGIEGDIGAEVVGGDNGILEAQLSTSLPFQS